MGTYGILLPCDGSEPMPVSVGDHKHVGSLVQGYFERVTVNVRPDEDTEEPFTACGYINENGLIDNLPINTMASLLFQRELRGNVVIVSDTPPSGEADGDHYDLPSWFTDAIFDGTLYETSKAIQLVASIEADAITLAIQDGVFTYDQARVLYAMMEAFDPKYDEAIEAMVDTAIAYYKGRAMGIIKKFDPKEYEQWKKENLQGNLTDEEIEKFWEENS